ncbi:recombinase family protein [Aneurinibacillus aneurinilyticus]|uniref:Resolvase protein n=1 Tax=Aneurinibacillus aneurinilyticus ATCC 12856 TaxID=649747 RepID=U1WWW2_ANEAE|nr:recombinase family protein [Aneurinibacillus aneurinilyticus]ERI07175.1 resolvase protein [Aneurinibacillus aneurinilyticus ATCC 12856]MED0705262.1 recombinase family protein [Aneurinibacillus aneurinilyticus]MED0722490.1 recombinase family protein [Aneurinibacillus aneurinilyticus]MED0733800.1 recombinase family protein [Aneurinibacillus aneurinilyticus]MED0739679.1 recombinase family protein [Aneurinibacillus aneurinilyticus]
MIAIYARVSTAMQAQEGYSLDAQIELCVKKALSMGFKEHQIKIYREEGYSGEDIDIRPAMIQLREDVANGFISHVIVTHPDRLSRDMTDKLIVCREFEKNGSELSFTDTEYDKSPEGILFFNILSAIAAYELALIRKRTIRGRLQAVEKDGKIMPMRVAPFGYELINAKLIINEEEAKFVKLIYQWYVYEHLTLREIGQKLYDAGVRPKRGESPNWSASSIRRILTSEIYIGKYYYNRRKTKKVKGEKTESGYAKKTYDFRNESDWIQVDVPAIIDNKLFALAQEQKEKNVKKSGNPATHQYLLKSLIRCKYCGRRWESTTYSGSVDKETGKRIKYAHYRCPNKNPKKYGDVKKCTTVTIRSDVLDEYVWNIVKEFINNPQDYLDKLQQQKQSVKEDFKGMLNNVLGQITSKEKSRDKIKTMFMSDLISEDEMKKDLRKLNQEISELKVRIDKLERQLHEQDERQLTAERIEKVLISIKNMLQNEGELLFEDKRFIIESLVDEIILEANENGENKITIVGLVSENQEQSNIENCSQYQEI